MHTYVPTWGHTKYIHACAYTYMCNARADRNPLDTYMHTYIHAYIHTCIHTYIHTRRNTSYIHAYSYILTYTHTCNTRQRDKTWLFLSRTFPRMHPTAWQRDSDKHCFGGGSGRRTRSETMFVSVCLPFRLCINVCIVADGVSMSIFLCKRVCVCVCVCVFVCTYVCIVVLSVSVLQVLACLFHMLL